MQILFLLCLCLTFHQQLRSYGDGPQLKVSSDRLVKPGIEPAAPGLQGKRFIHYTTAPPIVQILMKCRLWWHFIGIFTVCKRIYLRVSDILRVKDENLDWPLVSPAAAEKRVIFGGECGFPTAVQLKRFRFPDKPKIMVLRCHCVTDNISENNSCVGKLCQLLLVKTDTNSWRETGELLVISLHTLRIFCETKKGFYFVILLK